MRRKVVAIAVVLIFLVLSLRAVKASELVSIGFEGFTLSSSSSSPNIDLTTSYQTIYSSAISLPSSKYLTGLYLKIELYSNDSTDYATIDVYVNGVSVATKTWTGLYSTITRTLIIPLTGYYNSTFNIKVDAKAGSASSSWVVRVDSIQVVSYFMDENYAVDSTLTSLKYIPPGADNTPTALLLNQTEVLLPQTYNLSQGAVTFYLKWDGTKNIMLSDNIGIDSNGYLYIKNNAGTVYTLDGVTPPIGTYVPVYISWTAGEGYIMLNSTRIMLSWNGNVTFSKVGEVANQSSTLIDEFKLYDTYIPYSSFEQGTNVAQAYVAFPNATAMLNITTMDGSSIDSLKLSAYSANWTLLGTATWELGQTPTLNVPGNGAFIVIESATTSTTVYVPAANGTVNVAIPGTAAQYIPTTIEPASYPTQEQRVWDWLIVKDSQGNIVYRNKWGFTATNVLLKSGGTYLIEVATDGFNQTQVVYTGLASTTIKVNLPTLSSLMGYSELTTYYRLTNDTLQIYYYDPQNLTDNITLTLYDAYNRVLLNVTYPATNLLNFKTDILPYRFVLSFHRDGHNATWPIVVGHINEGHDSIFFLPKGIASLLLILMMLFSFTALSAAWAPVMTLVMALSLAVGGIVAVPAAAATFLGVGGFLAFMSQANLNFLSIKQLASQMAVVLVLLQIGGGIAGYVASTTGMGGVGIGTAQLQDNAIQQLAFWQNYTPQYTDLGAPVTTDTSTSTGFLYNILKGGKFVFMALGAPPDVANSLQILMYVLMAVIPLYMLFGREV